MGGCIFQPNVLMMPAVTKGMFFRMYVREKKYHPVPTMGNVRTLMAKAMNDWCYRE